MVRRIWSRLDWAGRFRTETSLAEGSAAPNPVGLVHALAHEIANLLAATRMHTHLIDSEAGAAELANVAATIAELSSRTGSLLAQIGPLLSPASDAPHPVAVADVLSGLGRDLEESCETRVRFEAEPAAGLPKAAIDSDPLHHILLTAIYQALEDCEPDGVVTVSAAEAGEVLAFAVEGEGGIEEDASGALRGRTLAHAVAAAILRERGGRIDTRSSGDRVRVEVIVPAVSR